MSNNNVILFPRAKRETPPQTLDDIKNSVKDLRATRIMVILNELINSFVLELKNVHEVDVLERQDVGKEMGLVIEAINSLLHKYMHLGHSFHEYAEEIFIKAPNGRISLKSPKELHESMHKVAETKKANAA